jgi:hypothetical protein
MVHDKADTTSVRLRYGAWFAGGRLAADLSRLSGRNRFRARGLAEDTPPPGAQPELRSGDIDQVSADQLQQIDKLLSLEPDTTVGLDFQQDEDQFGS